MSVTPKDVDTIARLAKIALTDDERQAIARDLDEIVGYVDKQKSLSLEQIVPTTHVLSQGNVLRPDVPRPSLSAEEVLQIAPAADRGHFVVPPAIEENS